MTLREFLTALATNADQLASFQANPEKEMQNAGLSPEEQELVKSGDEERVKQYLQEREPGGVQPFPFTAASSSLPSDEE